MKKIAYILGMFILSFATIFSLASCGADCQHRDADDNSACDICNDPYTDGKDVVDKYTVVWKNYDGTVLETDIDVESGTVPSYDGTTPQKSATAENTYTFAGWSPSVSAVTGNITYIAEFSETVNKYTVTWKNWDDSVLEVDLNVEYGAIPSYDGSTPTKTGNTQYTYTFSGWDKAKSAVTGDITYVAQFASKTNTYTVTWQNWDSSVLEVYENVLYGTMPDYNGSTPTKASDAQYTYTFSGWTPTVDTVAGDVTYVAQFTNEVNKYTVTWQNWDGTILEMDENVEYGTTPAYDGDMPTKPSDVQYTYAFSGWSPSVDTVIGNTVYIAQFANKTNSYTVTWQNWDGTVLEVDENIEYGATPTYNGSVPTKEGNAQYTYAFSGWDPTVDTVTGNVTYVAQFEKVLNKYKVTWKNDDGTVLNEEHVEYGTMPSFNGTPIKDNERFYYFVFKAWTPEISAITEDTTYTAVYDKFELDCYTITYTSNSSTFTTITKSKGETITITSITPTLSGYDFVGWNNIYEDTVYQPGDSFSLDGDINLVAMWKKHCQTCSGNSYVVETIDCDRCSSSVNGVYVEGIRCSNCDIDYGFIVINGVGDVCQSCYYNYGKIYKGYHVTCTKCGGRGTVNINKDCASCYGSGYDLPSAPTVESVLDRGIILNTVEGYEYSIDGINFQSSPVFAGLKPNTTYHFYQRQKTMGKIPFGVTSYELTVTTQGSDIYYITYNLNGGENNSNNVDRYFPNDSFIFYKPVKKNYDFVGWRYNGTYITKIDETFNTDIELEAIWKERNYLLSFDLDGGDFSSPQEISVTYVTPYGSTVKTYAVGEKVTEWVPSGSNVFLGWYLEEDYVTRYDFTTPLTDGMVLYAKFHILDHVYNANRVYYNVTSRGYTCSSSEAFYFAVTDTCTIRLGGTNNSGRVYLGNITTNRVLFNGTLSYGSTKSITVNGTPEDPQIIEVVLYLSDGDSNMVFSTSGISYNSTVASASFTCLEQKEIPNPTKPGYTFIGWTGSNGDTPQTNLKTPTENLCDWNLKANWIRYKIEYVLNGGTANNPTYYTNESDDIVLSAPKRDGYTFVGWISSDILEPTKTVVIPSGSTGDRVYTAVWKANTYIITYSLDGGANSDYNPATYTTDSETIILQAPTREHYVFKGWFVDLDFSVEIVEIKQGTYQNYTLYAKWEIYNYKITYIDDEEVIKTTVTVSFDSMGGTAIESQTISRNNVLKYPKIPTKSGYYFCGWYLNLDDSEAYNFSQNISSDITLYAKWKDAYIYKGKTCSSVSNHYSKKESVYSLKCKYYVNYTIPYRAFVALQTGEYTFSANGGNYRPYIEMWNEDFSSGVEKYGNYNFTLHLNAGEVVYFRCFADEPYSASNTGVTVYPITINIEGPDPLDGGCVILHNEYTYTTSTFELNSWEKDGYRFLGWYNEPTFENQVTEIPEGSFGDYILYAKWERLDYTISYDLAGGTLSNPDPIIYNIQSENIILQNPTKKGHTFLGWITNNMQPTKDLVIPTGSSGNRIYTAVWEKNKYTVTWQNYDGTVLEINPNVKYGEIPTFEGEIPTKEGNSQCAYKFIGWDKDVTEMECDVTYIAQFEQQYFISYNLDGGINSNDNPDYYTSKSGTITLVKPTRLGYTFIGWSGTNGDVPELEVSFDGNDFCWREYTAHWEVAIFTVDYVLDGGVNPAKNPTAITMYDEFELKDPTRTGYTFEGWYHDAEFTSVISTLTNVTSDIILYAKFAPNQYSAKFINDSVKITLKIEGYADRVYTLEYGKTFDPYSYDVMANYLSVEQNSQYAINNFLGWYKNSDYTSRVTGTMNLSNDITLYGKFFVPQSERYYYCNYYSSSKNCPYGTNFDKVNGIPESVSWYHNEYGYWGNTLSQYTGQNSTIHYPGLGSGTITLTFRLYYASVRVEKNGQTVLETSRGYNVDEYDSITISCTTGDHIYINTYPTTSYASVKCTISIGRRTSSLVSDNDTDTSYYYDDILVAPTYEKEGYSLKWVDEQGNEITDAWNYTTDKVFRAVYSLNQYKIKYVLNGGTNNLNNPSLYTIEDAFTLIEPVKEGYTFKGWYLDSEFTQKVTSIEYTTGDYTLYAKFTANSYNATLDFDGGIVAPVVTYVCDGEVVDSLWLTGDDTIASYYPAAKEGYIFGGWYLDESCETVFDFSAVISEDTMLYAKWISCETTCHQITSNEVETESIVVNGTSEIKITFIPLASGELTISTTSGLDVKGILYNQNMVKVAEADDISDEDYNFSITYHVEAGKQYTIAIKGATTLTKGDCSVLFDFDGNMGISGTTYTSYTMSVCYDSSFELPTPIKDGYEFVGWFDENGNKVTSSTWNYAQDTTLCAQWAACVSGHDILQHNAQEPTCTEIGWHAYETCSRCDYTTYVELQALGHIEVTDEAVVATCTESGLTEGNHCSVCNEVLVVQEVIPANGHNCGEWIEEVSATCECEGTLGHYHCSACDKNFNAEKEELSSIVIFALGHAEVQHSAKDASCTEIGWNAYETCSRCDYTTYVEITELGHNAVKHGAKAPTCTDNGWNAYETCSRCDYTTYAEIPAFGHTEVVDKAVLPTCTETGLTEGKHCSECDEVLVVQEIIPANGHNYANVVTAPTCTEQGYTMYTCTVCGDSYVADYINALGHTEVVYKAVLPTCTETGVTEGKHCSTCNEVLIAQEVVSALGHDYIVHEAKEETCTEVGWNEYHTCSRCDYTTYVEISAFGHTEVVDKAVLPTCTETGLTEGKHCSVCDEILVAQENIAALGHDYESVTVDPTLTHDGYTLHTCAICADSYIDSYVTPSNFVVTSSNRTQIGFTGISGENLVIPPLFQYDGIWYRVTGIDGSAFYGCTNLEKVTISDGIKDIGRYAFGACINLKVVTIGKDVMNIGTSAFNGCTGLIEINYNAKFLNELTANVSNGVFSRAGIEGPGLTVNIGKDVYEIPSYLFSPSTDSSNAPRILKVNFAEGSACYRIGMYAFANCKYLTSVMLPSSIKSIAGYAFSNCSSLASIIIPDTVTSIGDNAFSYCTRLTIYCEAESQPSGWSSFWNYSKRPVVWGHKETN